ncbi:MAG: putative membrane protein YhfC [Anaerolineaceae bacterium]|nr:YhfC family intramembrane metalloprotease [Anaerolineae bacterium]MBL1171570.1 YhfC family intramembrane metalloprotease [Chloroflexota bacterium]MDL1925326.1 YhfC family intramembrane metalloprotease [Anaerolineae bacterium AMX1]WKZ54137.1 MAG: YhfC family glutamic-type intramembrane protease [Anaerolineales bacterium]GJQ37707.1 MAG: putative membrane protein YhfC [Anaerolineaceae bacterium]
MIAVTSSISVLGMIVLPILLGFWLTRKFGLSWKLFFAGALTFIASQILHIPFLYGTTALFNGGTLPSPPPAWSAAFNAVFLGLAAGIFEETARWVLFKFFLKNARSWNEGVLVGAGHGGVEAFILGVISLFTVINMVVLKSADLSTMGVPAEQLAAAQQQVAAFWASPAYMGLLGFVERIFAITLHLALSTMVLYGIANKKPLWFWLAVLWHSVVDAAAVYLMPIVGALAVEGVVALMALVSLGILFGLRKKFEGQRPAESQGDAPLFDPTSFD